MEGWLLLAALLYVLLAAGLYSWYRQRGGLPVAVRAAAEVEGGGRCRRCGAQNSAEFTYCRNCTEPLAA